MAVDLGGHPRDLAHQLLAGRGIVARVGAQLLDEGLAAAMAGLARHPVHLGANAADLAQADIVDLARREVGRGLLADLEGVIALRRPAGRGRCPSARNAG